MLGYVQIVALIFYFFFILNDSKGRPAKTKLFMAKLRAGYCNIARSPTTLRSVLHFWICRKS